jgi:hypothetical protein
MRVHLDLRKTMAASKERMKIFDTAFDNRSTPYQGTRSSSASTVPMVTTDGVILNLNNAQGAYQRKDNTTLRGDVIKVGYRQTGDHRFAVAQYGLTTSRQKYTNIHGSQHKATQDRKFDVHPSEIRNRLMINMMKEVDRRKHLDDYRTEMKENFSESVNSKNRIQTIVSDLHGAQQNVEQTADVIDLAYLSANIKKVRVYDPISHDTVIVDKDIFDKVNEHKNITFVKRADLTQRNAISDEGKKHLPGDNVKVHVYTRKQPSVLTQLPVKMGHKWADTNFAPVYKRGQLTASGMNITAAELGQGTNPTADRVFDRYAKAPGDVHKLRDNIQKQHNADPVNDVAGFVPRRMRGRSSI